MRRRRRAHGLLLGALSVALSSAAWVLAAGNPDRVVGGTLYRDGHPDWQASVAGHDDTLPVEVARCINCHEGTAAAGPRLTADWLLEAHERRGGPPSRYDEATFCRVLRHGVDAAYVQLPREMPRYTMTDRDCHALWSYLIR